MKVIKNIEDLRSSVKTDDLNASFVEGYLIDGVKGIKIVEDMKEGYFKDCIFRNCSLVDSFSYWNVWLDGNCRFYDCDLTHVVAIKSNGATLFENCRFKSVNFSSYELQVDDNLLFTIDHCSGESMIISINDEKLGKYKRIFVNNNMFREFTFGLPYYYYNEDFYLSIKNNQFRIFNLDGFAVDCQQKIKQLYDIIHGNNTSHSNLRGLSLTGLDLTNFDMGEVAICKGDIRKCNIKGCDFSKCILRQIKISDLDFSDIKEAIFSRNVSIRKVNYGEHLTQHDFYIVDND